MFADDALEKKPRLESAMFGGPGRANLGQFMEGSWDDQIFRSIVNFGLGRVQEGRRGEQDEIGILFLGWDPATRAPPGSSLSWSFNRLLALLSESSRSPSSYSTETWSFSLCAGEDLFEGELKFGFVWARSRCRWKEDDDDDDDRPKKFFGM